jgi:hypothetical protein
MVPELNLQGKLIEPVGLDRGSYASDSDLVRRTAVADQRGSAGHAAESDGRSTPLHLPNHIPTNDCASFRC